MQIFFTIIKSIAATLLIAMIALLAFVHFERDSLHARIEQALCNALKTDVIIGSKHIDPLSHFPYISFSLHNTILYGPDDKPFIRAEAIAATITPLQLLYDHLEFRKIWIEDGQVDITRLPDGSWSYEVFKTSGEQETESGFSTNIRKAELKRVRISFRDGANGQFYSGFVEEGSIGGKLTPASLTLELDLSLRADRLSINNLSFCEAKQISVRGNLYADHKSGLITFEDFGLQLSETAIDLAGSIHQMKDHQAIDLHISADNKSLESLKTCLPPEWKKHLRAYTFEGKLIAEGKISGRLSKNENPRVEFRLTLEDGEMQSESLKAKLTRLSAEGSFDNGALRNLRSSSLRLENLDGRCDGGGFKGNLEIRQLDDPYLSFDMQGSLPFAIFFPESLAGMEPEGSVDFLYCKVKEIWVSQIDFTDLAQIDAAATLRDIRFLFEGKKFSIDKAILENKGDSLFIEDLQFDHPGIKGDANGWLAHLGNTLEGNDPAYLHYTLNADLERLDLTDFMNVPPLFATSESGRLPDAQPASMHSPQIYRLPSGTLQLHIDDFTFGKLKGKELRTEIETMTHELSYEAGMQSMKGLIEVSGRYIPGERPFLESSLQMHGVEMEQCFADCNNFLQRVVTKENIKGRADLLMHVEIPFNGENEALTDQMKVIGGISIREGELIQLSLLEQFSSYIHSDDLRHIRFARMDNFFEIRKEQVYLPVIFIQSNAINLAVNGIHTFNNEILYNFKINAGQVIANKMKRHNPTLRPIEARKEGTLNLYYTLHGTLDDFDYKTERIQVLSSFRQSEEIRREIRDRLELIFDENIDFIEPAEWEDIPEYPVEPSQRPVEYLDPIEGGN